MPPDMAVDMRRSKLKAEEAALLAGELKKPSWESRNEGIHERVSFEDTIWGFDLAGGSYYKTPLRVVAVKPDSRAEKAGIRPGDRLKRINDIDTSTLTIQEAHEIIVESGVYLRIAVTAPEDEEDSYHCYEDPLQEEYDLEAERHRKKEEERLRQTHAKVSSYWSLQWPWVSKRRIIYRESNCFMVPSKYEEKNRSKFSPQPFLRPQDDVVLDTSNKDLKYKDDKAQNPITPNGISTSTNKNQPIMNGGLEINEQGMVNGKVDQLNGLTNGVEELDELHDEEMNSLREDISEDNSQLDESKEEISQNEVSVDESNIESSVSVENSENSQIEEVTESKEDTSIVDDEVINEVLESEDSKANEDDVIESILSASEDLSISHSDER